MTKIAKAFFLFSGLHALLIGLMPFYLPVLAWQEREFFSDVLLVISLSGLGFILCLPIWTAILRNTQRPMQLLFVTAFITEITLVSVLLIETQSSLLQLSIIGLLNGAYACFYWTTQRLLFSLFTHDGNSGNHFGNFQILVALLLKVGILCGGLLIDANLLPVLLAASLLLSITAYTMLPKHIDEQVTYAQSKQTPTHFEEGLSLNTRTRTVFVFDGIFLYLESFFWVLSLYWLLQNNIAALGILVVALALLLAATFFLIKKHIDLINPQRVYLAAVLMYALSWLLRSHVHSLANGFPEIDAQTQLYVFILIIAFFTTFFRLSFNKRFFDSAARHHTNYGSQRYLIIKSYWSQMAIFMTFGALWILYQAPQGLLAIDGGTKEGIISLCYLTAVPFALIYALYGKNQLQNTRDSEPGHPVMHSSIKQQKIL